jgi:hypothetical protein
LPGRTWWIDQPRVLASEHPGPRVLSELRARGFDALVSLLAPGQPPVRYDRDAITRAGWSTCAIPVPEGEAPSLDQMVEFTDWLDRRPPDARGVVVHCQSGLGRAAMMGAVYWIARGLSADQATARIEAAAGTAEWRSRDRDEALRRFEALRRRGRRPAVPPG